MDRLPNLAKISLFSCWWAVLSVIVNAFLMFEFPTLSSMISQLLRQWGKKELNKRHVFQNFMRIGIASFFMCLFGPRQLTYKHGTNFHFPRPLCTKKKRIKRGKQIQKNSHRRGQGPNRFAQRLTIFKHSLLNSVHWLSTRTLQGPPYNEFSICYNVNESYLPCEDFHVISRLIRDCTIWILILNSSWRLQITLPVKD